MYIIAVLDWKKCWVTIWYSGYQRYNWVESIEFTLIPNTPPKPPRFPFLMGSNGLCLHTYIHTYVRTYVHTYNHTLPYITIHYHTLPYITIHYHTHYAVHVSCTRSDHLPKWHIWPTEGRVFSMISRIRKEHKGNTGPVIKGWSWWSYIYIYTIYIWSYTYIYIYTIHFMGNPMNLNQLRIKWFFGDGSPFFGEALVFSLHGVIFRREKRHVWSISEAWGAHSWYANIRLFGRKTGVLRDVTLWWTNIAIENGHL